ncbi:MULTISPECIES: glucosamine-6-phosphate deaminase [unclassified Bacillus (in: firmicutes)]|uniref:glucosamine-6-phosphate deaminase n=1 Tax=unclassified Bacillus (in: firmicutes) TaxID=185979 RepID=UPI0008F16270|nr:MULTISPECIES: glucosamine-6-phosphate deaminase [unclassified Bacillus (in: firmicutes)]SFB22022.1 glucosamine-6-phosphate deaminase [Bacillus sp. UNCCL13]SFQ91076.1 glucosamine-6-phosphate deaminase [Bacillus sp. cl95]
MRIIRTQNYTEMSNTAGQMIAEKVRTHPKITLGLATGSTPSGMYDFLKKDYQENKTSYRAVSTVNLDEYIGLSKDNPNSYHDFMKKILFDHIDIPLDQTHISNGMAADLQRECDQYDRLIQSLGGVDVQILGIGQNGHIGFNEPGTSFESNTHIVSLTENTRIANSRFFPSIEDVPTNAITMGISSILKSKEIILLASGVKKAEAISKLLNGEIDESFPASALKLHHNVIIIADNDALSLI